MPARMLTPIRSMLLAAAVVLLAAPTLYSQSRSKDKPASEEQTGLKVGETGARVHPQGSGGQGALAGPVAQERQGRPGVLPLGRLVTVLPQAIGPAATRPQVHRGRRSPDRRHQL